jgi:hypothetical protein
VSFPVVSIPEADADLKEALAWYEGINPDLGVRFLMAVESAVEVNAEHPLRFQNVHNQMRRIGIRRFPWNFLPDGTRPDCGFGLHPWTAYSEKVENSAQR